MSVPHACRSMPSRHSSSGTGKPRQGCSGFFHKSWGKGNYSQALASFWHFLAFHAGRRGRLATSGLIPCGAPRSHRRRVMGRAGQAPAPGWMVVWLSLRRLPEGQQACEWAHAGAGRQALTGGEG